MTLEEPLGSHCHSRTMLSVGIGLGVVVGFIAGSVIAMTLGDEAIGAMRHLADRLSGRNNRVNFELLLQ
jgi:hypothetical protein